MMVNFFLGVTILCCLFCLIEGTTENDMKMTRLWWDSRRRFDFISRKVPKNKLKYSFRYPFSKEIELVESGSETFFTGLSPLDSNIYDILSFTDFKKLSSFVIDYLFSRNVDNLKCKYEPPFLPSEENGCKFIHLKSLNVSLKIPHSENVTSIIDYYYTMSNSITYGNFDWVLVTKSKYLVILGMCVFNGVSLGLYILIIVVTSNFIFMSVKGCADEKEKNENEVEIKLGEDIEQIKIEEVILEMAERIKKLELKKNK